MKRMVQKGKDALLYIVKEILASHMAHVLVASSIPAVNR
jgi:hypothetical protein